MKNTLSRNHSVERERARLGRGGWRSRQPLLQAWDRVHRLVTRLALVPTGEAAGRQRPGRARSPFSTAWIRLSDGKEKIMNAARLTAAWIAPIMLWVGQEDAAAGSGKFDGLYFETKGRGETIVLIHGGQMDRRMWDAQFDLFARQYRVIRYDIRGFGRSDTPDKPYSNAGDLHSLLRHLRVKKAALMGLSLGAAVATDFALEHPEMADSLLLVCPGLGGFPFQDKANDLRAVVEAARDDSSEKAADLWLMNPYMSVAMENPTRRNTLRDLARDNGRCWLNNPLLIRPMKPPAASGFGKFASRRWSSAANATSQTFTK